MIDKNGYCPSIPNPTQPDYLTALIVYSQQPSATSETSGQPGLCPRAKGRCQAEHLVVWGSFRVQGPFKA